MSRPLTHLRNLAIATLVILTVLLLATQPFPFPANAQAEVRLEPTQLTQSADPGDTARFEFTLVNESGEERVFRIDVLNLPGDYTVVIPSPTIRLAAGGSTTVEILVTIPEDEPAITVTGRVRARDVDDSSIEANAQIDIIVTGPTRTPTNTPDRTDTPTPTEGLICEDAFEDDDDLGSARRIDVNTNQRHVICPIDDEDWLVFGGVAGKVYTIDIIEMDPGLDLTLELFDEDENRLEFNDDFFNRDPPDPNDLRPRILRWTSPEDGQYYIRVRDAASGGAAGREYVIALIGDSHGPTPTTIVDVCLDLFEPDGLPEQAPLITSNELQEDKRLCPDGDADWVTFFGKTGKRYFLFTETSRYRGENQVNRETQAGADTILVLTDRDGVSIIDFNDDVPGGETLDSQIEFIPDVDGFYFAQVKNVGDIGNQFIRYDLILQLCVPGQSDCGRTNPEDVPEFPPPEPGDPEPTQSPTFVATPIEEFTLDEAEVEDIDIDQATPTPTSAVNRSSEVVAPPFEFAHTAFQELWQRNDQPVWSGRVERSWLWGPALTTRTEPYHEATDGTRSVQYFEKARMERGDPLASLDSPWSTTSGLLVQEMIRGQIQVGNNEFVAHPPARIALAGDGNSASAPTYASLHELSETASTDRTGEYVMETLLANGKSGEYQGTRHSAARLARFVPETGHNIPVAFWRHLNARGIIYEQERFTSGPLVQDWLSIVGYPISEPYWIQVRTGGEQRDVMVQAFQRRMLTYTPDNAGDWQVEMGNVGRHYYQWRYGRILP